jgi:excinuclease ABC subunit A
MQFMADVELTCETCGGRRFKDDVLEVRYRDRNIFDVLEMTVDEAITFFGEETSPTTKRIVERLGALQSVGLGYVKLGQSSSTLSGGESQRVKLASFLLKDNSEGRMMFIFDEPTTGLHFHDIKKLLASLNALISKGHTVIIIEHNPDVIRCADHVIDLGPEGGAEGGRVVFEGTPEELAKCPESYTGRFLAARPEAAHAAARPEKQPGAGTPKAAKKGTAKKSTAGKGTVRKVTARAAATKIKKNG